MQKSFIFLFSLLLLLAACEDLHTDPPGPDPKVPTGAVDFSNLQDGQQSRFLQYRSTCDDLKDNFSYTHDTLLLDVMVKEGKITFQESLTPRSPNYLSGTWEVPITYEVTYENEMLLIPTRFQSALYYFYGNDTIHLSPDHNVTLQQDACKLKDSKDFFVGNDIGYLSSFEVGPLKLEEKTAVSCVPLIINLDAYLIYDSGQLYMSHTIEQFSDQVNGWVKI